MVYKGTGYGSIHSCPLGRCLGVALRASPGSPPGPGCSPLATPHGAEPAPSTQYLNPLFLAVPGGQCVWQAMGYILMAPVDVLVQASQHHTLHSAFPRDRCKMLLASFLFLILLCPKGALVWGIVVRGCASRSLLGSYIHQELI